MARPIKLIEIDTENTLKLVKGERQPYTILSHRWFSKPQKQQSKDAEPEDEESEEVSLQEFKNPTDRIKEKRGYKKITEFCDKVKGNKGQFVWTDTCCLDKEDPALFFEELNSMFEYYKNAEVCYVYLHDITVDAQASASPLGDFPIAREKMQKAEWFTRGWTLQELIAPKQVVFFDGLWNRLGTKDTLRDMLHHITRIDPRVLSNEVELSSVSVARKMSWAAHRTTGKAPDLAYCLMGLFDVRLPLVHAESGEHAFVRLQEAIASKTDDQSLFAWQPIDRSTSAPIYDLEPVREISGANDSILAFARSPKEFATTGHVKQSRETLGKVERIVGGKLPMEIPLYWVRNSGMTFADRYFRNKAGALYLAILSCTTEDDKDDSKRCAIIIQHIHEDAFIRRPGSPLIQVETSHDLSKLQRAIRIRTERLLKFHDKPTCVVEYWNRDKTPGEGKIIRTVYWDGLWRYLDSGQDSAMLPAKVAKQRSWFFF